LGLVRSRPRLLFEINTNDLFAVPQVEPAITQGRQDPAGRFPGAEQVFYLGGALVSGWRRFHDSYGSVLGENNQAAIGDVRPPLAPILALPFHLPRSQVDATKIAGFIDSIEVAVTEYRRVVVIAHQFVGLDVHRRRLHPKRG